MNSHAKLTAEMAFRYEKLCDTSADTLLQMQSAHALAEMRARVGIKLNDALRGCYGDDFAGDPRRGTLMNLIGGRVQGLLSSAEEAEPFKAKRLLGMGSSTKLIAYLLVEAPDLKPREWDVRPDRVANSIYDVDAQSQ